MAYYQVIGTLDLFHSRKKLKHTQGLLILTTALAIAGGITTVMLIREVRGLEDKLNDRTLVDNSQAKIDDLQYKFDLCRKTRF